MSHLRKEAGFAMPFILGVIVLTGVVARIYSWPGFATHDSLFITREALEGEYTTYHPLLNALLVRFLAVPLDSYWLYTSLQIAWCCVLLYQSMRHSLYHQGASLLGCVAVVAWAASLHTLLYLGVVWKDVPIAYGLVFMAALAYRMRVEPEYRATWKDGFFLGLSLFFCLGLRHGMIFNAVLLPLLLGWRSVIAQRKLWLPIMLAIVGFSVLQAVGASKLVRNDNAHMLRLKVSAVSQPFLAIVTNRNGYISDDHEYDRRLAVQAFGGDYAKEFTPDYFRNHLEPVSEGELDYVYRAILKRTPRLCVNNFSLCVSSRVQMFLGTLQPSTSFGGMTFYDLGTFEDCRQVFGMVESQCRVLDRFETSEKPAWAPDIQRKVQSGLVETRSPLVRAIFWNLLPALLLLVAMFSFGRAFSPLWLVAVFFIAQIALPFMTAMANDFRYYYFLFPFAIVFAPPALHLAAKVVARESEARMEP
jgi:hypothetical protein